MYFQHAILVTAFCIIGLLYIDDTDLVEIARQVDEIMAVVGPCMQQNVLCWNGSTRATSRVQKIDTCSWTPVEFVWDSTGIR